MYEITKDGFVFLVMGYTGKKAAEFKEAYIKKFNETDHKTYRKRHFKNRLQNLSKVSQNISQKLFLKNKLQNLPFSDLIVYDNK